MGGKGFSGKLLAVDLSNNKTGTKEIDDQIISKFVGGRGAGIKFLMDMSPANIDPLSPENPIFLKHIGLTAMP